jgi:hypothetical protein
MGRKEISLPRGVQVMMLSCMNLWIGLHYELGDGFGEAVVDGVIACVGIDRCHIAWMGRVKVRHVR